MTHIQLLLSSLAFLLQFAHLVAQVADFLFQGLDVIGRIGQVSVPLAHSVLQVLVLLQQSLGADLQLVVLLVHVVQRGFEIVDLLVVDVLDVIDLLALILLDGLDLMGQLEVLLLQLPHSVDVTGQAVVEVLQRLLLLFASQSGGIGILRVRVVVQAQFVQRVGGLVPVGLRSRRSQGLHDASHVLRRLFRLLKIKKISTLANHLSLLQWTPG